MKKQILSILLTLCIALSLVPTAVLAAGADVLQFDISVADKDGNAVQITSLNQNDVLGDGKVSFVYDAENEKGILTLNGAELSSEDNSPIDASDMQNLEIVLKGKNKIESEWLACIMADNLTFSGNGSIEITTDGRYNWPVLCDNTFTVKGGNVKISSIDYALCLDGALIVSGGTLELIASDEDGYAIDIGWNDLIVVLGDDRIMLTGANPDGSDARVTDASEVNTIKDAKYVKIFDKYIPVTYNPGEHGTKSASVQNKTYGEDLTLSNALFTRDGYKQIGWALSDGGGKAYELGAVYTGNKPLTLYPVWDTEQYGITYDLGGGTVTVNPDHYTVESENFTLNNPEKEGGYEFVGWSGTGLTGTDNLTVTVPRGSIGDREYTAHWHDIQAPTVDGLENGKTYCSAVEFTAADNDGEPKVTVNGVLLNAQNGKYILAPKDGKQIVVVSDNDGNSLEFNVTVNNGHTGGTATCTKKAICMVCGEEYGEIDSNNHADLKHIDAKAATDTAEGNIEYWYCEGCGKYFADKDGNKEITKTDTVIAKLPDEKSTSPVTGDASKLAVLIALLFAGVDAGAATTVAYKNKKRLQQPKA